jgi:hypothetical protein
MTRTVSATVHRSKNPAIKGLRNSRATATIQAAATLGGVAVAHLASRNFGLGSTGRRSQPAVSRTDDGTTLKRSQRTSLTSGCPGKPPAKTAR